MVYRWKNILKPNANRKCCFGQKGKRGRTVPIALKMITRHIPNRNNALSGTVREGHLGFRFDFRSVAHFFSTPWAHIMDSGHGFIISSFSPVVCKPSFSSNSYQRQCFLFSIDCQKTVKADLVKTMGQDMRQIAPRKFFGPLTNIKHFFITISYFLNFNYTTSIYKTMSYIKY